MSLYPISRDRSSCTLEPEKSVTIIYTFQNIKPLHRAVGSLMFPRYEDLVCLAEKCGVAPIMFHVYENSHVHNIFEARANSGDNKRRYKNTKITSQNRKI